MSKAFGFSFLGFSAKVIKDCKEELDSIILPEQSAPARYSYHSQGLFYNG
jgi:hypothetical protein